MRGTRMIVSACAHTQDTEQIREILVQCGADAEHCFQLIPGVATTMTPEALQEFFRLYPNAQVFPDRRRHIPPKPFGKDEWAEASPPLGPIGSSPEQPQTSPLALDITGADAVHAMGIDGSGVTVCVIDSGIDFTHPDLQSTAALDPNGEPLAADFTETDLTDTIGHGTAVAGCVAAQGREVYTITEEQSGQPVAYTRIQGTAPGVRLMSAKVFDARVVSGYDSSIIAALEWAADNGAQIINMSLGGVSLPEDGTDPLSVAVTALQERGILVLVSSGNAGGGIGSVSSPGSSPGAFTVGASTMYRSFSELGFLAEPGKWTVDQLAAFSSLGPTADGRIKPDMLAPGAFDWGLAPVEGSEEGQRFQLFGGTSQAAPLMAGAAALVYQAFHETHGRFPTPDEFLHIMRSTADDLGLPAHMQGSGRANVLRAVKAVLGEEPIISVSAPPPLTLPPGGEQQISLSFTNNSSKKATVELSTYTYSETKSLRLSFTGAVDTTQSPQDIGFDVLPDVDLIQVTLGWQIADHGPYSPRLMVALYDPEGRFVNYQRPNTSGDLELGKSVDAWVSRPAPGRWTARVVLRQGIRSASLPYSLSVRSFNRTPWDWVRPSLSLLPLEPEKTAKIDLSIAVPTTAKSGAHSGFITAGPYIFPMSIVVPIAMKQDAGTFGGAFQHGYQGTWGNGDWHAHLLSVPGRTRSLVAALQWPDPDNALEFYLVNPEGVVVMGQSNTADIWDDGSSIVRGGQVVLANPDPGMWRLILHSVAFSGRGLPEPYYGSIHLDSELLSPSAIQMRMPRGKRAPLALTVRNPGRMPLTVHASAHSTDPRLIWQSVKGQIKTGVDPNGKAVGGGHITLTTVNIPYGTRQFGVTATWDEPDVPVTVTLFDPVAQSNRTTAVGTQGNVAVLESNPLPGEWTVMASIATPGVESRTVNLEGATFLVAPEPLSGIEGGSVTVQPGSHAMVPLTVHLPESATRLEGRIVVTSTRGDHLGEIPFHIEADDASQADAEVAATDE